MPIKLHDEYPYVYVDGVYLKRSWDGEIQNVSVLVAIGVNSNGYREIIGAAEGMKEDHDSWKNFFVYLKERGLREVRLVIGDKCSGMLDSLAGGLFASKVSEDYEIGRASCRERV